jgi:hypothetical protein
MVEWAHKRLTEWDIQLQVDDGFRLINAVAFASCQIQARAR